MERAFRRRCEIPALGVVTTTWTCPLLCSLSSHPSTWVWSLSAGISTRSRDTERKEVNCSVCSFLVSYPCLLLTSCRSLFQNYSFILHVLMTPTAVYFFSPSTSPSPRFFMSMIPHPTFDTYTIDDIYVPSVSVDLSFVSLGCWFCVLWVACSGSF